MNPRLLCLFVAIQVVVFQIIAIQLSRWIAYAVVGRTGLPAETSAQIETFRAHVGRTRRLLGILLILSAVLVAFALPLTTGQKKITLGVISLLSTAALLIGYVLDSRRMTALTRQFPEANLRIASLEPRTIGHFYPLAWEAVPLFLLAATVALTLLLGPGTDGTSGPGEAARLDRRFWILPLLQMLFIGVMFRLTRLRVAGWCGIMPRARAFHGTPEEALRLDERFRWYELRHSLMAKITVLLLLATMQLRLLTQSANPPLAPYLSATEWVIVVVLLLEFAIYLRRIGGLGTEDRRVLLRAPDRD
jgi:hypothetical protein